MNEFFIKLVLTIVVICVSYFLYERYRIRSQLKWAYIVPGIPLIGNGLDFNSTIDVCPTIQKYFNDAQSSTIVVSVFNKHFILSQDPKLVEFVLNSNEILDKTEDYRFLANWLGNGLLLTNGVSWKPQRKLLNPTFHLKILEEYVEIFNRNSETLIEILGGKVDESFDISDYISYCALDIISETAMGVCINAQRNWETDYIKAVKNMCKILVYRAFSPIGMFDPLYRFTSHYRTEKESIKILHDLSNSVIEKRMEQLKNKPKITEESDDVGLKVRKSFLDLLLETNIDGKQLSYDKIREEVDTVMFAGHDTSACAVNFAIYSLSTKPEIQETILAEQRRIFGDDLHRPATYRDLQEMKYLEMVIKETLRMYPSVPGFGRHLYQDVSFDGKILPRGCSIMVNIFTIGRNPKWFPNPEEFDPSRFDTENGKNISNYLPFSMGPRNCIGQKFAMLEMKCVLSYLVRNFEIFRPTPDTELVLSYETVLKPYNGINVRLKQRN